MNKKERLMAAVHHRDVDRLPTSFRAVKPLVRTLMEHFGIDEIAGIGARRELLARIGADFWSSGCHMGQYSTFVPRFLGPAPQAPYVVDRSMFYALGIHAVLGRIEDYAFEYPVYVNPPLANVDSPNDIRAGFFTASLVHFDFGHMENKVYLGQAAPDDPSDPFSYQSLSQSDQEFICVGTLSNLFMICCYLRGMEQFMIDLAIDHPMAERIVGEVGEFCLEFNHRELEHFGAKAELYGTWDDVAGQQGPLLSPKMFNQFFLPLYKRLIENVKRHNLPFSWHCCGSVHGILPAMIDAGVDIFDVVQTSARSMDLQNLYRLYGKDICFHGAVDVQRLLVFGSPQEVKDEVRKIIDLWGMRGGIVVAPSHEALPETPLENVLAIYEQVNGL